MSSVASAYPVTFEADGPSVQSRLTVFFRLLLSIPNIIVASIVIVIAEFLTFLAWFAVLFVGRYPGAFAGFTAGAVRWQARLNGYVWLLTGNYPPFSLAEEEGYPVRASVPVALEGRNRLTTFFRPVLVIPHVIVLAVLGVIAEIVLVIAWFAALFTASVPAGIHSFLSGVQRYNIRVLAYMYLLRDEYPPFSLS